MTYYSGCPVKQLRAVKTPTASSFDSGLRRAHVCLSHDVPRVGGDMVAV